ncbi:MAG TPA: ribonuclease P protein component [Persephonella sp.]|uniref:Ribonuclease P protein component n=1 Tax=Persephonella marina TaxID=309805 RepID=A0EWH0_9AQUI|nr:ribonuclease P protein component [Persephonella marina]ABF71982.1 ribonuclease P protein component [Persephonella marina]HCB70388.1 ribonuclease P protein component [Persephonella sp.]
MITLKDREIKSILSKGRSLHTENFIVIYRNNDLGYPRFAFILSRKFSKKAVVRNRAKRIIKEALRAYYGSLKNLSYDIIFIAKKNIIGKKTQDLYRDMEKLISILREGNGQISDKTY